MEQIGSKIKRLIKAAGFEKPKDFHKKILELNGTQAFRRFTLTRILNNKAMPIEKSVLQIANALLMTSTALREGTNAEIHTKLSQDVSYSYAGGSFLRLIEKNSYFVAKILTLKKLDTTDWEQDDPATKKSLKWIFVLIGKINIVIKGPNGEIKNTLLPRQAYSFDARQSHRIQNLSKRTSQVQIIHCPAENNIFSQ